MKKLISPLLLLLAAMIWGFAFTAQEAASAVPALTLGALRSILAAIFLLLVIILFDKISGSNRRLFSKKGLDFNKTELIGGSICGAILAAASFFQQTGINSGTDSGKAGFITALYVVFVPIYALALKKRARLNVWISVAIATVGFYLLCINDDLTIVLSDLYVIIAALIFPIHILTIDKFSPICDGIRMSCIQFFVGGILNAILALLCEPMISGAVLLDALLPIAYLGIASSGIAYTLQIVGQKGVKPTAASLILSLESVFAVIGAALFLSQEMTPREYIGCAVVFVAVILSQLEFKSKKQM